MSHGLHFHYMSQFLLVRFQVGFPMSSSLSLFLLKQKGTEKDLILSFVIPQASRLSSRLSYTFSQLEIMKYIYPIFFSLPTHHCA